MDKKTGTGNQMSVPAFFLLSPLVGLEKDSYRYDQHYQRAEVVIVTLLYVADYRHCGKHYGRYCKADN